MKNEMTKELTETFLRDVPRYETGAPPDHYSHSPMVKDDRGDWLDRDEVLAALTAALDGVDERAGEFVNRLRDDGLIATRAESADLITALLAQNAALRAERDAAREQARSNSFAGEGYVFMQQRAEAAEAEVEKLREAADWQEKQRRDAFARRHINAPEDPHVAALCERYGYGAVMDAASRLWARKDSVGAFYIGGCIGIKPDAALTTEADPARAFNKADWFWRTMDPEDCGDTPEEAISRAMLGRFCVCEIASSYSGPTRYGFIAPVLDPESDDEEFVHFATQQEAIDAAKVRAAITKEKSND